jgi:dihydrofolate reductase
MAKIQRLIAFNSISLDGYFVDRNDDMSWAKPGNDDAEFKAFMEGNASSDSYLLFGRKTYEMMESFWTSSFAAENFPVVTGRMNKASKIVFSRTLSQATWNNTRLVKTDLVGEIKRMKAEPGEGIAILGSGSIIAQLAQEGLIDEYQVVVVPIVLGNGRTMFEGVTDKRNLKLIKNRVFNNGNVLLCYEPVK